MKVLRVKSREYHKKTYYKYRINVPEEILEIAGIKEGDDLRIDVKRGEIRLIKKRKSRNS